MVRLLSLTRKWEALQYGGLFYNAISFRQRDAQSNLIIEADGQVFCTANRGVMTNQNFL